MSGSTDQARAWALAQVFPVAVHVRCDLGGRRKCRSLIAELRVAPDVTLPPLLITPSQLVDKGHPPLVEPFEDWTARVYVGRCAAHGGIRLGGAQTTFVGGGMISRLLPLALIKPAFDEYRRTLTTQDVEWHPGASVSHR